MSGLSLVELARRRGTSPLMRQMVERRNLSSFSATATARLVGTNGTYGMEVPLRKRDGAWQVCVN